MDNVMDLLVKQFTLTNPSEEEQLRFHSKTSRLLKKKFNESYFHEVFSILKIILTADDFPKDKVLGSATTIIALQNILSNISSSNVKLKAFYPDLLDIFLTCLKAGPSMGHLEIMKFVFTAGELKEHVKQCKSQELQNLIVSLTKKFSKYDGIQGRCKYTELFNEVIPKLLIKESLCCEQLQSEKEKILELHHFYLEQYSGDAADLHCAVAMEINSHFPEGSYLYKDLPTDNILIKHIETIHKVALAVSHCKYKGKIILEILRNILEAMKENKLAWKKCFTIFMDMLFDLLKKHSHLSHKICWMLVKALKRDAVIDIKDKQQACEKYICKLTQAIHTKHRKQDHLLQELAIFLLQRLVEPYVTPPLSYALVEFIIACLCTGSDHLMIAALWLVEKKNFIKWQDNPTLCVRVVLQLRKTPQKCDKVIDTYSQFANQLFAQFSDLGVLQYIENLLPPMVLKACEEFHCHYYAAIAENIIDFVEWQKAGAVVSQVLSAIDLLLHDDNECLDSQLQALVLKIIDKVLEYFRITSTGEGFVGILQKIFSNSIHRYHKDEPRHEQSIYAMMADKILDLYCLQNLHCQKVISVFLLDVLDTCINKDERYLPTSLNILQTLDTNIELLLPHIKLILSAIIDKGVYEFIPHLLSLYFYDPSEIQEETEDLVKILDNLTEEEQNSIYLLLELISKDKPGILNKHLLILQSKLNNMNTDTANLRVQEVMAASYPDLFVSHVSFYLSLINTNRLQLHSTLNILKSVASISNDIATTIINSIAELILTFDVLFQPLLLKAMKDIGDQCPNALLQQRPLLEILSQHDHLEDICSFILTFLNDIKQKEFSEEILKRKASLKEQTEKETLALKQSTAPPIFISYSTDIESKVEDLKKHLEMAGYTSSMDAYTASVKARTAYKETNYKDMKSAQVIILCITIHYTESAHCIKDVTLAKDLGKPMIPVLLEEIPWPPKGTIAPILAELLHISLYPDHMDKEENKKDGYWSNPKFMDLLVQVRYYVAPIETQIAEEYKYWTQAVDETEPSPEYNNDRRISASQPYGPVSKDQSAPLIYLSYSWDKQNQIKTLYWQLTNLGFTCWLDLNNLKGKESLNNKIQKALQEAHVIVCCVTPKYFLYPKCQAEIILVADMKKPIIPLLLENVQWSSNDILHQVFSVLPYIEFTEQEDLQNPWVGEKFNILIHELNLCIKDDDESENDNVYDDETMPLEESTDEEEEHWSKASKETHKSTLSLAQIELAIQQRESRDMFCCTIL